MPESKSGALPLGDIPMFGAAPCGRTHEVLYHGLSNLAIPIFGNLPTKSMVFYSKKNQPKVCFPVLALPSFLDRPCTENLQYKKLHLFRWSFVLALPIFPGSHPPSIVGAHELNFCVRDGNRWTLMTINTNYLMAFTIIFLVTHTGFEPMLTA